MPVAIAAGLRAPTVAGAARSCDAHEDRPRQPDRPPTPSMKLANDGGWCGLPAHQEGPKPFEAGLLAARPGARHVC